MPRGFGGGGWGHGGGHPWGGGGWGWGGPPIEMVAPPIAPMYGVPMPPPIDPSMMNAATGYQEIVGAQEIVGFDPRMGHPHPHAYPHPGHMGHPGHPGYEAGFLPGYEMGFLPSYEMGFMPGYEMGAMMLQDRRGLPLQGGYELGWAPPPPVPSFEHDPRRWEEHAAHRGWDRGHHAPPPQPWPDQPVPPGPGPGVPPHGLFPQIGEMQHRAWHDEHRRW